MTNRLKNEGVEDLQPDANYRQINNELDNASLEDFCKQLEFLTTSDDKKAKALFDTFKKGWKKEFGRIQVEVGDIFIRDLHPTQNVIYANKSLAKILNGKWNVEGYDLAVDAFLSEQSPVIKMGDPLVVCEIDKTYYLIDGHHRWSKAYSFNPNCRMYAYLIKNSKNIFTTADDVLKFAQGTLTALKNTSPINNSQPEDDYNMYTMSSAQLVEIVRNNLTKTVLNHIVNSPLVNGVVNNIRDLCTYLWANINVMKKYAPAGIHDRTFMPQYPNGDSNPVNAVSRIAAEGLGNSALTFKQLKKIVQEDDEFHAPGSWEPNVHELAQTIISQRISDEEIEGWLADQGVTDRETINAVLDEVSNHAEDAMLQEEMYPWVYPNSEEYPEWISEIELNFGNQADIENAFECAGWKVVDSDPDTGFTAVKWEEDDTPEVRITMSHGDNIIGVVNEKLKECDNDKCREAVVNAKDEIVTTFNLGFTGQQFLTYN